VFSRLGTWCHDNRRLVLGLWVAVFFIGGAIQAAGNSFREEFNLPDSESRTGFDILDEHFGGEGTGINGTTVFQATQGVDDPDVEQQMEALFDTTAEIEAVKRVVSPYSEEGSRQIASEGPEAGTIAYAKVELPEDIDLTRAGEIRDEIRDDAPEIEGLRIEMGGFIFAEVPADRGSRRGSARGSRPRPARWPGAGRQGADRSPR
jgi:putative drug exporter of the RND superfamily